MQCLVLLGNGDEGWLLCGRVLLEALHGRAHAGRTGARVRGPAVAGPLRRSPDASERLAGVLCVGELADTRVFGESPARLSDLVRLLMEVVQTPGGCEAVTMALAARTLGHLVRAGGPLMADVVEEQVRGRGRQGESVGGPVL